MNTVTPSPVSEIPLDELLWLHGKSWSWEIEPTDLPFQPDPQHTCVYGSERVPDDCGCDEERTRYPSDALAVLCCASLLGLVLWVELGRFVWWLIAEE